MVRANNRSTVRVCKQVYSVSSKLIGSQLRERIHETYIVLLDGMVVWDLLPVRGSGRRAISGTSSNGFCASQERLTNSVGARQMFQSLGLA
jgi:hypothetical protein